MSSLAQIVLETAREHGIPEDVRIMEEAVDSVAKETGTVRRYKGAVSKPEDINKIQAYTRAYFKIAN